MKSFILLLVLSCLICVSHARGQEIGTWQAIANLNTARGGNCVAYSAVTGKFYALGGRDHPSGSTTNIPIEEYDVANNTWTNKCNLAAGVSSAGAAAVGSYIYIAGGLDDASAPSAVLQRFDPASNFVVTLASMPAANNSHAVAAIGNKIYVLGGSSTAGTAGTTDYCYDITTNIWTSGAALPTAVRRVGGASDGTYVYVIGGTDAGDNKINFVQRYNPATNTWNIVAPLTTARSGPASFFDGKRIWAVNGEGATFLASTEYYLDGAWTAGPDTLNAARSEGAAYSVEKQLAIKAGGLGGAPVDVTHKAEKLSIAQPTPTPTPGLSMTLSSSTPAAGSHFTVDVTVQPIIETFDAWGMIIKEGGTPSYSFRLSNPGSLYSGARAMATNVHGLPTVYTKTLCSVNIPAGVAGNTYTVIVELVPAGVPLIPIGSYHAEQTVTVH